MFTTWIVSPASREARSTSATSCQSRRSCRAGNTRDILKIGHTKPIRSHPANQGAAAWQGTPGTFSGSVDYQIKPGRVQVQVEIRWIVITQLILYSTLDLLDPVVLLFAKEFTKKDGSLNMSESVNGQDSASTCSADQLRHQLVLCSLVPGSCLIP